MEKIIPFIVFTAWFLFPGIFPASGTQADTEKIPVVASIYPLKDIIQQVGGERVRVDVMVPPGATPHTFEPRPSDMIRLQKARLFVMVGAGLEFWAGKTIRSAGAKGLKVLVLSEGLPLIYGEEVRGDRGGHGGESADPHVWLDPLLTKEMADRVANALGEIDPSGGRYFRESAGRFKKEIDRLHAFIAGRVRTFTIKEYVAFHPAWNYFARRYGLKAAGVIEESPGKEASPRHIARLVNEVRRAGVRVVFAEPQFSPKAAEVIAREAGARVLYLDPLGGAGRGGDTYIGLMRYNFSVMEEAMK